MFKLLLILISSLFAVSCSTESNELDSTLTSHVTQKWSINPTSPVVSALAEYSSACANNLPSPSLALGHCFNPTPIAELSTSLDLGRIVTLCVATHESGSANVASLLVVDQNGQLVSEGFGNGRMQVVATLASSGRFKVYAGFGPAAASQRVKVLAGISSQFSISSTACTLR
jgi:hypothetical protein